MSKINNTLEIWKLKITWSSLLLNIFWNQIGPNSKHLSKPLQRFRSVIPGEIYRGIRKITLQTYKLGDFLFTLFRVTLQLNESIKYFCFKINIAQVIQYWYIRSFPSEATYSTRRQQKTDLTIPKWRTQLTTFPRITEMFESEN